MKKAVITGERQAAVVEVPDPEPKEDWALVKVHFAPMCTEYKAFVAGRKLEHLGHEAVGEVVEVAQPCKVEVGDRVVVQPQYPCGKCWLCGSGNYIRCQNGYDFAAFTGSREGSASMAQYVLKPSWLLCEIPDDVSYEHAALALCGLGPTFGAFEDMGLSAFDTVLICGLGPVGLGGIINAYFRGARVIGVEPIAARRERAMQLGAAHVLDPGDEGIHEQIMELTDGRGVDCAVDCAGALDAQRLCLRATRRLGRMAFVALAVEDFAIKGTPDLVQTGVKLMGSWHYNLNDYPKVMQVIQASPAIDRLTSHIFPFSNIQEAFETSASLTSGKILLKPWE